MKPKIDASSLEQIKTQFLAATPYHYASVGRLFDESQLEMLSKEIDEYIHNIPATKDIYSTNRKHALAKLEDMPELTRKYVEFLNSDDLIAHLREITGIQDLTGDPTLQGGGIHAIGRGGFLKIHTDFNWHAELNLHRRLNLLIYLNIDWQEAWGGRVELWNENAEERIFSLAPSIGNALLFETSDISYHGHPDPLTNPEGSFRKSLAMYYYSSSRPESEVKFGRSKMTNYVERPSEVFETDKIRRYRHKVQLKARALLRRLKTASK